MFLNMLLMCKFGKKLGKNDFNERLTLSLKYC